MEIDDGRAAEFASEEDYEQSEPDSIPSEDEENPISDAESGELDASQVDEDLPHPEELEKTLQKKVKKLKKG